MKINRNVEAIIVILLYLTCLYFWTLPIQKNNMPYGEVDAASHFAVADYTYQSDRSIVTLPYYIDKRYGRDNVFKPHSLWYPPPFHTALAIASVFGGSSVVPIYIANAIFGSLIVLSVYFLMRRFFGFEAALVSGFLLIFSMRDIMVYMWGQWPERMAFAYLPLVLYCFYKYSTSFLKKEEKPIYLYVMSLLLSVNFFIHPMDFFHSIAALIVFSLFLLIKERGLFFNIKHMSIAVVLFLLIISIFPLQTMRVFSTFKSGGGSSISTRGDISRLFHWFKPQEGDLGVPQSYFSYKAMIGPYWTVPLIFLGLFFILFRRNNRDLVLLGWLVSLYFMIHLDFIGIGRVHRSLSGTGHIFYPLMVLGVLYFVSFIPKIKGYRDVIKYGLMLIFVVFMFASMGIVASKSLKGAYGGVLRINPYQYDLTKWIKENTMEDAQLYHMGSISLAKTRWLWMIGQRYIAYNEYEKRNKTHVIVDYSDLALIGDQNNVNKLQEWEKQNLANNTLLYNKDYIRVYEFEG